MVAGYSAAHGPADAETLTAKMNLVSKLSQDGETTCRPQGEARVYVVCVCECVWCVCMSGVCVGGYPQTFAQQRHITAGYRRTASCLTDLKRIARPRSGESSGSAR